MALAAKNMMVPTTMAMMIFGSIGAVSVLLVSSVVVVGCGMNGILLP